MLIQHNSLAQFIVSAGASQGVCPGQSVTIGGSPSASGGMAPYTFSWSPISGLSANNIANPTATPSSNITYTLTVTDDTGAVKKATVLIQLFYIKYVDAGLDTSICEFSSARLGGVYNVTGQNVTYSWTPTATLDNPTSPHPISSTTVTTVYTLTASFPGCANKVDAVTITVIPTPPANAGNDTTINLGERVTLQGSGGFYYDWIPKNTLMYYYTANPDAEPLKTTTYYLTVSDETHKCFATDSMIVNVNPSTDVVFYNTFSPNGDGNNDTWYIGNIHKYPNNKLEIYNRNGKVVFTKRGYTNDWDGKSLGEELPTATYFYVMDLGDGAGVFHGTVTIIK